MSQSTNPTMFLNATADINTWLELATKAGPGVINPEVFYNKQLLDTTCHYDRAIVYLPNGEIVEGRVSSWTDFDDGDSIQVKIDGKMYLTHVSNVCLIDD